VSDTPSEADFAAEYARIGYRPGERWPAPPCAMPPSRTIELLRMVPTGAGLRGWQQVLKEHGSRGAR